MQDLLKHIYLTNYFVDNFIVELSVSKYLGNRYQIQT